ncbi:MAG: fimbrillin family protein [Candidatus Egerieousia sp.]|nr:fimbrillin family protein [Candidatus Egerieousia sp.]
MRVLNLFVCIFLTLFISCTKTDDHLKGDGTDWQLHVQVSDMQGSGPATKIIYSGEYSQHTEFETGDRFGLFVVVESGTAESPSVTVNHYEVYCSGLDNNGRTVWSIFRHFSDGHTSNYPLYEIMPEGSKAFAYYPYNSDYNNSSVTVDNSIVADFGSTIPSDQSSESAFTKYDLLVASNIEGCTYGEITRAEKSVTIRFSHAFAMLRFTLPAGSKKYDYIFDGNDFTPYKSSTTGGFDEYKYIFKPGGVLDIYIKYVFEDRLFKFATGNFKNLFPITTEAGHCYYLDEKAPKVPYSTAVDMGTSVMWASFNLEAENDPTATTENISVLKGTCVMWAVNKNIGSYGSKAYKSYNDSFTEGTKPSELPTSYNFSGDIKYDAARNMWGGEWRIPTQAEWQELFDACDYSIADGKITFTSKSTKNTITLKYAGYYDSATPSATNTGYYWSATSSADPTKAIATQFAATNTNTAVQLHPAANRYTGLPVRPVYSK